MAIVSDIREIKNSGKQEIDALLSDGPSWNYVTGHKANVITFGFGDDKDHTASVKSVSALTVSQREGVRSAIAYVASVTGIMFEETTSLADQQMAFLGADILSRGTTGLAAWSSEYTYLPPDKLTSYTAEVEVFLDVLDWPENLDLTEGTGGYETLLHEIGHALGLKHPFEGSPQLSGILDNTGNTVMSYTQNGGAKSTFQVLDIDALYWIYGGDGLGGDFGLNSRLGPRISTLSDQRGTAGSDSLHASGSGALVSALAGDDRIVDASGSQIVDGGSGRDTVVFSFSRAAYQLQHTPASGSELPMTVVTRSTERDKLLAVERLEFSDLGLALDTALGQAAANSLLITGTLAFGLRNDPGVHRSLLGILDQQNSLRHVFELALDSGLVAELAGGRSDAALVNLAYRNIVGSEPSVEGTVALTQYLAGQGGPYSQLDFLVVAAELPLNQAHVDLVGHATSGVLYSL